MSSLRRWLRRHRWARPLLRLVFASCLLLLIGTAVLALLGWRAKVSLEAARQDVLAAQQAVTDGDIQAARAALMRATDDAARAHRRTTGVWRPLWAAYGHLPALGPVVRETRGLIDETDVIAGQVLPPLVDSVSDQHQQWQGHVDVAALRAVAPRLAAADDRLAQSRARLAALPYSNVARVDDARRKLDAAVTDLAQDVREASVAAQVLPGLLGGDHPGRLLVVAQNQAEERATGGLIGAYAVLSTNGGAFRIERSGPGTDLPDAPRNVVSLGPDFDARYGQAKAAATWRSANLTPDIPSAGAILAGLCRTQLHLYVDGVIFIDPVALADLLSATGPVEVDGVQLAAGNAVTLLLHDTYEAFPGVEQNAERDAFFQDALVGVVTRLSQPGFSLGPLASAVRHAARSGHLQAYASVPTSETALSTVPYGGALPSAAPYLSVVTQDVGGSKLDYYLHRTVTYNGHPAGVAVDVGAGPQDVEDATVTVALSSTAPPAGLPPYVTYRADLPGGRARPVGQLRTWVSVYLGAGASYSTATVDGRPVSLSSQTEKGLAVFSTYVDVNPGQTVTLVLKVQQPARAGSVLLWRQQPRLVPDELSITRADSSPAVVDFYASTS